MQKLLKYISIGIICVCSFLCFSFDNVFADEITFGSDSADAVASQMFYWGATFQYVSSKSYLYALNTVYLVPDNTSQNSSRYAIAYGSSGSVPYINNSQHLRNYNITNFDYSSHYLYFEKNSVDTYYYVFKCSGGVSALNSITCNVSSLNVSFQGKGLSMYRNDTFVYWIVSVSGSYTGNFGLKFNGLTSGSFSQPLYFGIADAMPEEYYAISFSKQKATLIDIDSSSKIFSDTSGASSQLNNNVTTLNNNISSVDQLQSSYSDSMTDNFSKISSSDVGLVKNNSFINSSIWVVQQFNNLIDVETSDGYKPFNLMLFYSLFLGVALILIGKIRS